MTMDSAVAAYLALAAIAGLALGSGLVFALSRGWLRDSHAEGARSRETELVALAGQRTALEDRVHELAQRLEQTRREAGEVEQRLHLSTAQGAAHRAQAEQLARQSAELRRDLEQVGSRLAQTSVELAETRTAAGQQARQADEKLALLDQAEQRLREAFQNLAQQILDAKAERFREQNAEHLGGLLDPLKLQLREFREAVTQTHASEQRERGMLTQEIRTLKDLNQRISQDAVNLTRALRGDNRAQGAWGELVLERLLETAGLQAGREYETQASFQSELGGRQRPDVIVRLPDEKDIVIDSKVSLLAWERFVAAPDDAGRQQALREHVASLRRHVDGLSAKDYSAIAGLRTLDFVLLFVPIEGAFIEAVRTDDALYGYALAKNISLVSPSTLLATLRTVRHLWRIQQRNDNATEMARRAALLHDNLATLVTELEDASNQLDKARRAQASALRRLTEGGKGSVILQVQSLADMGAPVKKALSQALRDSAGGGDPAGDAESEAPERPAASQAPDAQPPDGTAAPGGQRDRSEIR
ncbi:DNA recombination protein RmuC [Dokdonella koreensis]|uniref:DNA recombination protein RmuC n=1 Tax=Dokdonella koreensis TaxID=323415 RepID=UPI00082FB6FE|nr:DNA recombination protein RmuC [Dokdonella koreensis]